MQRELTHLRNRRKAVLHGCRSLYLSGMSGEPPADEAYPAGKKSQVPEVWGDFPHAGGSATGPGETGGELVEACHGFPAQARRATRGRGNGGVCIQRKAGRRRKVRRG